MRLQTSNQKVVGLTAGPVTRKWLVLKYVWTNLIYDPTM